MLVSALDLDFPTESTAHILSNPCRAKARPTPLRTRPSARLQLWTCFFFSFLFFFLPIWSRAMWLASSNCAASCPHYGPECGQKPLVLFFSSLFLFFFFICFRCTLPHAQLPPHAAPHTHGRLASFIRLRSALGSFWVSWRFACAF